MKLLNENMKKTIRKSIREESEYQKYFKKELEKAGEDLDEMSDDEKKEFFNKIDRGWKAKNESKPNKIMKSTIRQLVREELMRSNNLLTEAFASTILRGVLSNSRKKVDKQLLSGIMNYANVKISDITDEDITTMDPLRAYLMQKNKTSGADYMTIYMTKTEKTFSAGAHGTTQIYPNTILAITVGNKGLHLEFSRPLQGYIFNVADQFYQSFGVKKSQSGYDSTGLNSAKKVADAADVAYVINLVDVRSKYTLSDLRNQRYLQKKGATALMSDKEILHANRSRYKQILASKLSTSLTTIDKAVSDAVDQFGRIVQKTISQKVRVSGPSSWDSGLNLQKITSVIDGVLRYYEDYISAHNNFEKAKQLSIQNPSTDYSLEYHRREVERRAHEVREYLVKFKQYS